MSPKPPGVVYQLDTTNDSTEDSPAVGDGPWGLAADSANSLIYVTDITDNIVTILSDPSGNVITTLPVGADPRAVAADPSNATAYVANTGDSTVSVIGVVNNYFGVLATVAVGAAPDAVAADPGTGLVSVANSGDDTVSVLDEGSDTVIATIPVGTAPDGCLGDLPGVIGKSPLLAGNCAEAS